MIILVELREQSRGGNKSRGREFDSEDTGAKRNACQKDGFSATWILVLS